MKESAMLSWCAENFGDVEPMPIEMGSDELCKISYSDEYKSLSGSCRRSMSLGESSQRALSSTAKVIAIAPAFYTVWNYRYSIIKEQLSSSDKVEQGALVNKESDWSDEVTSSNPKNYQIWSYRQALSKVHPSPQLKRELPIIQSMIDEDTKNYHVWSYRKWCVLFFKDFNHESPFTDMMIRRDIYNNSAWTHRMFVWQHTESSSTQVIAEIDNYSRGKIELAPQNISCWTYSRGLYELFLHENYDPSIIRFAEGFIDGVSDSDSTAEKIETIESSYALEFSAHVYSRNPSTQEKALRAYQLLSDKFDPIRANLWQHKIKQLKSS